MSLRVALIGCVASSAAALGALLGLGPDKARVVGVITRRASTFNADFCDLMPLVAPSSLPVLFAEEVPDDAAQAAWLLELQPDIVMCIGWSQLLGPELLGVAPRGVIGYHPAALPANRGRHPLIWAIALGLSETASSFFLMEQAADSGALIDQQRVTIDSVDDAAALYAKMLAAIRRQVPAIVERMNAGPLQVTPQNEAVANYWRKRSVADGRIDWRMPAQGVERLVRALARPYPGAEFVRDGQPVKLWKCAVVPAPAANHEPGKVLYVVGAQITVKCGVDAVQLVDHELLALPAEGSYL
jgi:methionyl-tRNA formyltransferase